MQELNFKGKTIRYIIGLIFYIIILAFYMLLAYIGTKVFNFDFYQSCAMVSLMVLAHDASQSIVYGKRGS
jgi:hypothetical protein